MSNENRKTSYALCAQCRKKLRDPLDNPVYVVQLDKYFCDDKCWNKWRKSQ